MCVYVHAPRTDKNTDSHMAVYGALENNVDSICGVYCRINRKGESMSEEKERLTLTLKPETKKFYRQEALDKGQTVSELFETIAKIIKAQRGQK